MYHGRVQLGQDINLFVICTNSDGYVIRPDEVPDVAVYSSTGHPVANGKMPVLNPEATDGLFTAKLYLSETFTPGKYQVVYRWKQSSYQGQSIGFFEILPGATGTGQILAMSNYQRDPSNFIVQHRQSGYLYRGRNPVV